MGRRQLPVLKAMGKTTGSMKMIFGAVLPLLAILFAVVYIIVRTVIILVSDYQWYEIVLAWVLLGAECFILMHGVGYFLEIYHVVRRRGSLKPVEKSTPRLRTCPPVAIIVSSFKEPIEVVENTLISFYNLTYPNKRIYFLDDTRYELFGGDPAAMAEYRRSIDDLCQRIGVDLFQNPGHFTVISAFEILGGFVVAAFAPARASLGKDNKAQSRPVDNGFPYNSGNPDCFSGQDHSIRRRILILISF